MPRPDDVPPPPRLLRWAAPALLLAIALGLSPLWWAATAPPHLPVVAAKRDARGTLLVPTTALRPPSPHARLEPAGPATLFVVRDGRAHLTPVRLGPDPAGSCLSSSESTRFLMSLSLNTGSKVIFISLGIFPALLLGVFWLSRLVF